MWLSGSIHTGSLHHKQQLQPTSHHLRSNVTAFLMMRSCDRRWIIMMSFLLCWLHPGRLTMATCLCCVENYALLSIETEQKQSCNKINVVEASQCFDIPWNDLYHFLLILSWIHSLRTHGRTLFLLFLPDPRILLFLKTFLSELFSSQFVWKHCKLTFNLFNACFQFRSTIVAQPLYKNEATFLSFFLAMIDITVSMHWSHNGLSSRCCSALFVINGATAGSLICFFLSTSGFLDLVALSLLHLACSCWSFQRFEWMMLSPGTSLCAVNKVQRASDSMNDATNKSVL